MAFIPGVFRVVTVGAVLALAACSGGGGGGSSPLPIETTPPVTATVAPVASATPVPTVSTSGFVYDLPDDGVAGDPGWSVLGPSTQAVPGLPIAGADVYVGPSLVLGATAPGSVPSGASHARTAADGSFTIGGLVPGKYALTIFAPAPHVTVVHRDLTVAAGSAAGTYMMATPSVLESAWLAQQTADRIAYGAPALVVDEAALEAARYWANFMAVNGYFGHCIPESLCSPGDTTPAPANYGPQDVDPQHRFDYFHGFGSGGEGENIAGGFASWQAVDSAFMSEVAACPNAIATNCPFGDATGHFLNIVDPRYVWTGVALTTAPSGSPYYDEEFTVLSTTLPSSTHARALHPAVRGLKL